MRESSEPDDVKKPIHRSEPHPAAQAPLDEAPGLPPDLQAAEAELARLRPRAAQIDRDRLLYRAGWAAAKDHRPRSLRLAWPIALGGMTAVAATLLGMLLVRPTPTIVERVVYVQANGEEEAGDAARSFAQARMGKAAGDDTAPGGEQSVWTVGHFLRSRAASSQRESDLLPLDSLRSGDASTEAQSFAPVAEPTVLSSRSFDSLLEERSRGARGMIDPDCQTPNSEESIHDF